MVDDAPAPSGGGAGMPAFLSRRIGSFTVGVWLLILAGGVAAGLVLRRLGASFDAPAGDEMAPAVPDGTAAIPPGGAIGGGGVVPLPGGTGGTTTPALPATPDNNSWMARANAALVARGYDPAAVHNALVKWLGNEGLTPQEKGIITLALSLVGPPPEGAPPIRDVESPTTPVPTTPTPPTPPPPTTQPVQPAPTNPQADHWNLVQALKDKLNRSAMGGPPLTNDEAHFLAQAGIQSDDPTIGPAARYFWRLWLDSNGYAGRLT